MSELRRSARLRVPSEKAVANIVQEIDEKTPEPEPAPEVKRAKPEQEVKRERKPRPERVEPDSPRERVEREDPNNVRAIAEEINKPARRNFETRMVVVNKQDTTWGADIVDMKTFVEDNDGYYFLLTVIDIFTRYAWAVPLKTKSGEEVTQAFKSITKERKPEHLWTDQGKEFLNKDMEEWMASNDITIYHTFGKAKSAVVERFNRTLKTIMWRELDARNTKRWVEMLPEIVSKYNTTPHSSLRIVLTPTQAGQYHELVGEIWDEKAARKNREDRSKRKFAVGDKVRVSRLKGTFDKGFDQNWTRETHIVDEVLSTSPVTYKVRDLKGELLEGTFYNEELMHTDLENRLIEHVLEERDGRSLVKWLGLPASQNTWIDSKRVTDVFRK